VRQGGLKDLRFTVSGLLHPTVDDILAPIVGLTGSYEYGPGGDANGATKYTGEAVLKSYKFTGPVNAPTGWVAQFERSGDGTRGTYSA
jgi:hypothetical protein